MLLATTVQQSVAYVIAALVVVGFVLWLIANLRRAKPEVGAELELAPNRKPYYDDEGMEGKRLDRFLGWGLVSLTIVAVGLPLYWLAEPGRQSGAVTNFAETFAHRGELLSLPTAQGGFNCQGCHGGVSGGWVQYNLTLPNGDVKAVAWWAPSLDDVALRMSDDQLEEILTYGRPFSPMPAWGIDGGGALNDQQIGNLIAYIETIQITPEEAQAEAADALETAMASGEFESEGEALFNLGLYDGFAGGAYSCGRCHTQGWSYGEPESDGNGALGPNLTAVRDQFPGGAAGFGLQVDFVSEGSVKGQAYGAHGQGSGRMPGFGDMLTPEMIQAVVEYERNLGDG
jgi:mono/diheme cytochrome c family protein